MGYDYDIIIRNESRFISNSKYLKLLEYYFITYLFYGHTIKLDRSSNQGLCQYGKTNWIAKNIVQEIGAGPKIIKRFSTTESILVFLEIQFVVDL